MRRRKKAKFDYYVELGISEDATADEIKKAYRRLAVKFHPDKNPDSKSAECKFKRLAEAYEVLGDIDLRAQYDNHELPLVRKEGKSKADTKKKTTSPFVDFIKENDFGQTPPFTKYSK